MKALVTQKSSSNKEVMGSPDMLNNSERKAQMAEKVWGGNKGYLSELSENFKQH